MTLGADDVAVGEHPDALSIAGLYTEVEQALARTFPRQRQLWVRGEVHSISDQAGRAGHCYLDLVDPETAGERQAPVLRVKCWRTTWGPLRATLKKEGIELQPGMVVVLRGTLDFYRPRAEIGFILAELDVTALLGRLAAQRAALIRALAAEGLLERNRALPVPAVPLRVGLVASPGTEGFRDFVGQLAASGFAFSVAVVPATVQGPEAPRSMARALAFLGRRGPDAHDLVVMVRGGGSKGDLAAFDAEPVARAVATCPLPVWTGIGHTGDESVADIVAGRSFVTPTECGRELVARVGAWWESSVVGAAERVARRAAEAVGATEHRTVQTRERLAATARHLVQRQSDQLAARVDSVVRCAPRITDDAHVGLVGRAARLGPLALGHLERGGDRLGSWRRLLAAYDVDRQLERGYTLTVGPDGRVVRSAAAVSAGQQLVTRFADGTARSTVTGVDVVGQEV
ncbi:MAG TPA: exodeoxyribonuclease VII large subunit [Acidimicrobiales bacterium]|nr:exodeoxyribonuclease VII large subunit [Acidimicrobiales bacterium]